MAKTLTIEIKQVHEVLGDLREAFKIAASKRPVHRARPGVYFTSIEAARNLLTPNRLALLRAIRTRRPQSVYGLAKIVKRHLKNVQDDVQLLERYGLVRLVAGRSSGFRRVTVPQAPFARIALKIAI